MGRKTRKKLSNDESEIEKKEKKERKEEEEDVEYENNEEEEFIVQEFEENEYIDLIYNIHKQLIMYKDDITIPLCENLTPDLLATFILNNC